MTQIQLHEYPVESDSLSSISLDDGAFIANVLDASDLLASDSELSEDESSEAIAMKDDVKVAFSIESDKNRDDVDRGSSFDSITSEVRLTFSHSQKYFYFKLKHIIILHLHFTLLSCIPPFATLCLGRFSSDLILKANL